MQITNTLLRLAAIAAVVEAQAGSVVKVTVGADGLLLYSPSNIGAEVGTVVEFDFFPNNHSVTQSSFMDPCHPLAGGFFSGFVPTQDSPSATTFSIIVNDTNPIWFYCGQTTGNHCQSGMVGAINAPTRGNTLDNFIDLAKTATTSTSPPGGAVGGILKVNSISTSSSMTSASSSAYTKEPNTSTSTSNGAISIIAATETTSTHATALTSAPSPSGSVHTTAPSPSESVHTTATSPSGSVLTTATSPSGSVLTTATSPRGSVLTTVTSPSGSVLTTAASPNGSALMTETSPSGSASSTKSGSGAVSTGAASRFEAFHAGGLILAAAAFAAIL